MEHNGVSFATNVLLTTSSMSVLLVTARVFSCAGHKSVSWVPLICFIKCISSQDLRSDLFSYRFCKLLASLVLILNILVN